MRDGLYDVRLKADGRFASGVVNVAGNRLSGGDAAYQVDGLLRATGDKIEGQMHLSLLPSVVGNAMVAEDFFLAMTGTSEDSSFDLCGTGPLGIIIGISGHRSTS